MWYVCWWLVCGVFESVDSLMVFVSVAFITCLSLAVVLEGHDSGTAWTDLLSKALKEAQLMSLPPDIFKVRTSTIILLKSVCLSLFANYSSQFLLDRLGRFLKLFVSTVIPFSHQFASQSALQMFFSNSAALRVDLASYNYTPYVTGPSTSTCARVYCWCQTGGPTPPRPLRHLSRDRRTDHRRSLRSYQD